MLEILGPATGDDGHLWPDLCDVADIGGSIGADPIVRVNPELNFTSRTSRIGVLIVPRSSRPQWESTSVSAPFASRMERLTLDRNDEMTRCNRVFHFRRRFLAIVGPP